MKNFIQPTMPHSNNSAHTSCFSKAGTKLQDSNKWKLVFRTWAAVVLCIITCPLASAQATRTWVSGVGDDANPCSRTAPGKTFAGAISKTAAGGEISVLDPGGFGGVSITKSITINGEGTLAGILASGINGITINAGSTGIVNLTSLSLNGAASGLKGINITSAAEVNIERCVIANFSQAGIEINCTTPCRVNVRDTVIRDCVGGSISAKPNSVLTVKNCSLLSSQYGVRAEGAATVNLEDCVIAGHVGNGVVVNTTIITGQAMVNINDCFLTDNGGSAVLSKGTTATIRLSNNTITGNLTGITIPAGSGGIVLSYGNNQISGNTVDGSPTGTVLPK